MTGEVTCLSGLGDTGHLAETSLPRQLVSFKFLFGLGHPWDLRSPSGKWDVLHQQLSTALTHRSQAGNSSFTATCYQRPLTGSTDPSGFSLTPRTGCHSSQFGAIVS